MSGIGESFGAAIMASAVLCSMMIVSPAKAAEMGERADSPDTLLLCHFNEGKGNVTQDVSAAGHGRQGKLVGNPTWTEGRFGGALLLDGQKDAVDFGPCSGVFGGDAGATTVPAGSIEFWFSPAQNITGKGTPSVIVDCCQSPRVSIGADGQLEALYVTERWSAETAHVLKSGLADWKAGTWYKVLFSWNEKGHSLFVNETPMASDNLAGSVLVGLNNVTVGAYFNGTTWSDHFAGKVDELCVTQPQAQMSNQGPTIEKTASGLVKETRQCQGTITGHVIRYVVFYPPDKKGLPVLFHQYGDEKNPDLTQKVNERIASYGVFTAAVGLGDEHGGYDLQDYKDAIDDVFQHYADRINTGNVAIAGVSYGGAVVYGMSVHFPYLFSIVVPIYGIADYGYDETESWYPMILKNSPTWGPIKDMDREIGDRTQYRETRYLVRNAIFGAKNNPYGHFEILQDAEDGVGKPGVQAQQSRRFVAELKRLGYTNYRYTETPKAGFVYPSGQPIRYTHGFWSPALSQFELSVLKPALLNDTWKRPPFRKTGDLFIPSFLEVPFFRFDLGSVRNNCDEAADVSYDISNPDQQKFKIVPRTEMTQGQLRLMKLAPDAAYQVTCGPGEAVVPDNAGTTGQKMTADAAGTLVVTLPATAKGATLMVECVRADGATGR